MANLTDKQRRFCEEYCIDWNATRAAIEAGYSEKTAYSIGQENLKKPELKKYIDYIRNNISEAAGISALMIANKYLVLMNSGDEKIQIQALKGAREMLGFDEPKKKELEHKVQDLEALKALFSKE